MSIDFIDNLLSMVNAGNNLHVSNVDNTLTQETYLRNISKTRPIFRK